MICTLEKKRVEALNPTNIFTQTPFWGRIKKNQKSPAIGLELTVSQDMLNAKESSLSKIVDDILIFIKYIDNTNCFAYVPYGPELEPTIENQGVFLEELSESIRPHLPSNCLFIRYDLVWENRWATDEQHFDAAGNWLGAPSNKTQEFSVNFNTNKWNLKKSVGDLLPKNTFLLDLSLSEKKLLGNMRYNTRYNVKKALNNGIRVKEYGVEHIADWYKLYHDTALRHGMPLQNEAYFSTIISNQDNSKNGVTVKMLMAENEGEFLSSMFLVLSKKRGTYLYGASTSSKQKLQASYALQWESIKISKEWGCNEYDMFGSAPNLNKTHPLHGVHVYKKGFGGDLHHKMGCWDYPYDKKQYAIYRNQEILSHIK